MSNTDLVKELREATGLSFKEINSALTKAGGDKVKAIVILKELGASVAEKKSSRATTQGVVDAYIHSTRKVGVLVELLCETDFVAKNPEFGALAHDLSMHIAAMAPADTAALLAQSFIKDPALTVKQLIEQVIAKIGENIQVGHFARFQL